MTGIDDHLDPLQRRDLDRVRARLIDKFSAIACPEAVERCLAASIATFESARVRTYLVLLIERGATDLIRAEADGAVRSIVAGTPPVEHRLAS